MNKHVIIFALLAVSFNLKSQTELEIFLKNFAQASPDQLEGMDEPETLNDIATRLRPIPAVCPDEIVVHLEKIIQDGQKFPILKKILNAAQN
jgi:hypothetical protein